MKRIIIVLISVICVCSCNSKAIKGFKSEIETLQMELTELQAKYLENDTTVAQLTTEHSALERNIENLQIVKATKEKVADSLYKVVYPTTFQKNQRGVNQEILNDPRIRSILNDPRFKIKQVIVY